MQAIYPFVTEAGLGTQGVYLGRDLYGGSFVYDPFTLYERRTLTNPNMLVIGEVGSAKSSLVKTYCFRQAIFGRRCWIGDPKGEYGALARALGVEPIRLAPGGAVKLNPLDRSASPIQRLTLTQALTATALARSLEPEEHAVIREALRTLDAAEPRPVLPDLVRLLFHPTAEMASRLYTGTQELTRASRVSALALQRLCDGDLRGMLDGPTSIPIDPDAPLTVMDLSAFYDSSALAIVMTCAAAYQRALIDKLHADADAQGRPARKFINVFDEAWRVLSVRGVGEWLQDRLKKTREFGQNILVMHRLSDLNAAGAAGSREVALAEGLLHDTQTRVVYRQVQDELPRTREALGLTALEARLLPTLDPGVALWKLGTRSFLVQHRLSAREVNLVDTDGRMRDRL